MNASVLVLVLTLISVDGDLGQVDEGLLDGLRPGDAGSVYYELSVGGARRQIEVGEATVLDADELGTRLRVPTSARPGHLVRFELPLERAQAAVLIEVARERLDDERFEQVLDHLLERLVPADPAVERKVVERLAARSERRERVAQQTPEPDAGAAPPPAAPAPSPVPEPLPAAQAATERIAQAAGAPGGDEETTAVPVEVPTLKTPVLPPAAAVSDPGPPSPAIEAPSGAPPPRVETDLAAPAAAGDPEPAPPAGVTVETRPLAGYDLLRVPAGAYRIGLDLEEAQFYSQHPRFRVDLAAFTIDRRPVSRAEFLSFDPSAMLPGTTADEMATGVTFAEAAAYCGARGRRLPTEFEWEAAMGRGGLEQGLLEWTDSWYRPYPGNPIEEEEYGESNRVLRGSPHPGQYDIHRRRFAAPTARHLKLGFRCAGA